MYIYQSDVRSIILFWNKNKHSSIMLLYYCGLKGIKFLSQNPLPLEPDVDDLIDISNFKILLHQIILI